MDTSTNASLTDIAREAGAVIQSTRESGLTVSRKCLGEVVTSADLASHKILVRRFAEHFPDLPLISEEGESRDFGSGPMLVADELDGTAPFSAGSSHWGVMLALIDREPIHSVIFLPDLDITISAEKGEGCRMNGQLLTLKEGGTLSDLLIGAEINNTMSPADWRSVQRTTSLFRAVRCTASAAASAYELLAGITHAYLNVRGGKIWDFAAISLAVEEAGGTATDSNGCPLQWNTVQMSFMATSGLAVMQQWLKDQGKPCPD